MPETTKDRREALLEQARSHVGYRTKHPVDSYYGGLVGYQGMPWNGAFVDVVFRETGLYIPACVNTTAGLSEFIRLRRWHSRPEPGDVVFYNFPAGGNINGFFHGHVGIVTDTREYRRLGKIMAIEGMTDAGLPNANIISWDGVYERVRTKHEILGFGRPDYRPGRERPSADADGLPEIKPFSLPIRQGKRHAGIGLIQLALARKTGLRNPKPDTWDGLTMTAYAQWQRSIGYVGRDANGQPDRSSLARLGRESGYFRVSS